jgi:anti-sigma B factor antagonist
MDAIGTLPARRRTVPGGTAVHELRIEEDRPRSGAVVLAIHGDADLHSAGELEHRLLDVIRDGGAEVLVLDLSETTFLDSMAIGVLLRAMKRQRASGGRFRVVAPGSEIRRIFEMTLLDRVFELDLSRDAALAAAAPGPVGAGP